MEAVHTSREKEYKGKEEERSVRRDKGRRRARKGGEYGSFPYLLLNVGRKDRVVDGKVGILKNYWGTLHREGWE